MCTLSPVRDAAREQGKCRDGAMFWRLGLSKLNDLSEVRDDERVGEMERASENTGEVLEGQILSERCAVKYAENGRLMVCLSHFATLSR